MLQQQIPTFVQHFHPVNETILPKAQKAMLVSQENLQLSASNIPSNLHQQTTTSEVNLHNKNITCQPSYQYQNLMHSFNSGNVQTQIQQGYIAPQISTSEQTFQREAHHVSPEVLITAVSKTAKSCSIGTKTVSDKVLSSSNYDNLDYFSSEDEAITNENWSGAINAMAATIPGKGKSYDTYSTYFLCIYLIIISHYL